MPGPVSWKNMIRGAVESARDDGRWYKASQYALAFQADEDERRARRSGRTGLFASRSNGNGSKVDYFIGPDGGPTKARPHVHVIHNEDEGLIVFVATQSDGSHSHEASLPINASGNEVNAMQNRMRQLLR